MKIYYGNGNCSIEGATEGMFMIMTYNGAIEITDLTPDGYAITTRSNKIAIFPYQGATLVLGELFSYVGTFKIVNAEVADINGKGKPKIYKVMDYSELLDIAAEDMTTVSEDLNDDEKVKQILSLGKEEGMSLGLILDPANEPKKGDSSKVIKKKTDAQYKEVMYLLNTFSSFTKKDAVKDDGEIRRQQFCIYQMIPQLVSAIQELSAKVTALENAN